jgi:hypothetical protein
MRPAQSVLSETERAAASPAPLPFADLLAALRDRGLSLGVREHLVVGRLLARLDDPDLDTVRSALAAVLARNRAEVKLVRETFDLLYTRPSEGDGGTTIRDPEPQTLWRRWVRLGRRRWVAWLAATAVAVALAAAVGSFVWSQLHPPQPFPVEIAPNPQTSPRPTPRRKAPRVFDTYADRNQVRAIALAGCAGAAAFLWLYGVRTGRLSRRLARRQWREELDGWAGPHSYELVLKNLPPPFAAELLDDAATLLGRRIARAPHGRELDVNRTIERTLNAGLAPQIVLRVHSSSLPLLVLEDVAPGMHAWRRRVEALLTGLAIRGVPVDRWCFNRDANRLFRSVDGPAIGIKQLARRYAESPLLVVSCGEGVLEGQDFRVASWVGMLQHWRYRAWLHPVTDNRLWSTAFREARLDVWPMTPAGVLAAARQLARGEMPLPTLHDAREPAERRVVPLDVDRMRWLLTLASKWDADLADLLRRRFIPHVPEASLVEALAAPPLVTSPGVGPSPAEVHEFVLGVLEDSRPFLGSAADHRWRLDRALQQVQSNPLQAETELAELAGGPFAAEVEQSVRNLIDEKRPHVNREVMRHLTETVLRPIRRRAKKEGFLARPELAATGRGGGLRWTWPRAGELVAGLLSALAVWAMVPFFGHLVNDQVPVRQQEVIALIVNDPARHGFFTLKVALPDLAMASNVGPSFWLFQDDAPLFTLNFAPTRYLEIRFDDRARGHWYYARAKLDPKTLAVSESVWVEPAVAAPILPLLGQSNAPGARAPAVAKPPSSPTATSTGSAATAQQPAPSGGATPTRQAGHLGSAKNVPVGVRASFDEATKILTLHTKQGEIRLLTNTETKFLVGNRPATWSEISAAGAARMTGTYKKDGDRNVATVIRIPAAKPGEAIPATGARGTIGAPPGVPATAQVQQPLSQTVAGPVSTQGATLIGTTVANKVGGPPVPDVVITADGASSTTTTAGGMFTLHFPAKQAGDVVQLAVRKPGFVVVNPAQLRLILPKDAAANSVILVLSKEANRLNAQEAIQQTSKERLNDLKGQDPSLVVDVVVNTIGASGEIVNGYEVFVAPVAMPQNAIRLQKLSSPTTATIYRGLYDIWAAKGTLKGETVRVDLVSIPSNTLILQVPIPRSPPPK